MGRETANTKTLLEYVRGILTLISVLATLIALCWWVYHIYISSPKLYLFLAFGNYEGFATRVLVLLGGLVIITLVGYTLSRLFEPDGDKEGLREIYIWVLGIPVGLTSFGFFICLGAWLLTRPAVSSVLGQTGVEIALGLMLLAGIPVGCVAGALSGLFCFGERDTPSPVNTPRSSTPTPSPPVSPKPRATPKRQERRAGDALKEARRQREEKMKRVKREVDIARKRAASTRTGAARAVADFEAALKGLERQGVRFSTRERVKLAALKEEIYQSLRRSHVEKQKKIQADLKRNLRRKEGA